MRHIHSDDFIFRPIPNPLQCKFKMRIFRFVYLLMLALSSCSLEVKEKTGPDGSWWLGGADGGVFIKMEDDAIPNDRLYQGIIYFDSSKKICYQGEFKLVGNIKFSPENHQQYQFWDGEKLHLTESSYLQPTGPIPEL